MSIYSRYNNQMFLESIDNKLSKLKSVFETYLNDKKKDSNPQPPMPSVRRPEMITTAGIPIPNTNLNPMTNTNPMNNGPVLQSKPMELDIKQLIIQGKTHDRQPLNLKNIQKEKTINIFFVQEQTRFKIQIKVVQNNLQIKINSEKATIEINFKRASRYKFVKPQTGEPKWLITNNELKDDKIVLVCNKDAKNLKTYFEGIIPEQAIKQQPSGDMTKLEEKMAVAAEGGEKQQIHESDDLINFMAPTTQQLADTEKFRRALKDMKQEEKNMILMDLFKIKKEYEDPTQLDRKKLKCPIHSCQKIYRQISQLKTHLKRHNQLNKHGIELTDYGTFEYGSKAMDLALLLGKMYPSEIKKIIKKMKTKQIIE